MNLTTTTRSLVAAVALAGGVLGFAAATAQAAPASATAVAHAEDGPEPVELNELGLPDLLED
ncbi:hypothetical protein [Streptomyces sp. NPDC059071]|uniref:hypothetical protein n=1 Tax=unclassified Streptomyces TaxID=2593676 RepID=UPI00363AE344